MTDSPKLISIVFALSISSLILISIFSYQRIKEADFYTDRVDHTYEVIAANEKILENLKGVIAYERGYLLTHDKDFLSLLSSEKLVLSKSFSIVKTQTADNPVQQESIKKLKPLIEERINIIDTELKYDSLHILTDNPELLIRGKNFSLEIRKYINKIRDEETRLMNIRRSDREKSQNFTPFYILGINFIAFVLLVVSFYFLNKELIKRIKAEKDLQLKIKDLNRSNSELEQFAYVASHDLQEPLRKIRVFISQLVQKYRPQIGDEVQVIVDKIESSAERMQMLIEDLLSFSKTVKTDDNKKITTDLNTILSTVLHDFSETILAKNAVVQVQQLPVIEAYSSQMTQLFQNLIGNALKFSKTDVSPLITVSYQLTKGREIAGIDKTRDTEEFHRISIADNGIGFDEQYKEKIFMIFQRLHNSNQYLGTGIGLAICKRVISNHNGFIAVSSTLGKGAVFSIYLPVV